MSASGLNSPQWNSQAVRDARLQALAALQQQLTPMQDPASLPPNQVIAGISTAYVQPKTPAQASIGFITSIVNSAGPGPSKPGNTVSPVHSLVPSAAIGPQAGRSRTSVGVNFEPPITANGALTNVIRTGSNNQTFHISGLSNGTAVHCYRNAILTMLLASRAFATYCQEWHMQREYSEARFSRSCHILRLLYDIGRAKNLAQRDNRVEKLWKRTCFPLTERHLAYRDQLAPANTGGFFMDSDPERSDGQKDALEWLQWLFATIDFQLGSSRAPDGARNYFRQVFDTKLTSRVECPKCRYQVQNRKQIERLPVIVLAVPDEPPVNVRYADWLQQPIPLRNLMSQNMSEFKDDMYMCSRCQNRKTGAIARKRIQQAPEIMTFALQRTAFGNGEAYKNKKAVEIPAALDVSAWVEEAQFGEGSQVQYRLRGVVSHQGSHGAGHYISYVDSRRGANSWRRIDDRTVSPAHLVDFDDSRALTMTRSDFDERFTPYILLYERDHAVGPSPTPSGRYLRNVGQGAEDDIPPVEHTKLSKPQLRLAQSVPMQTCSDDVEWEVVDSSDDEKRTTVRAGIQGEEEWPTAELDVSIRVDDFEIKFPTRFIEHFSWHIPREDVNITATISVPVGKAKTVRGKAPGTLKRKRLNLAALFVERDIKRRNMRQVRDSDAKYRPERGWKGRWNNKQPSTR